MSLVDQPARISLVAGSTAASCELCTSESVLPRVSVVIQHPRGGLVQLAACDWCVQALRRLSAASGGQAAFALSEGAGAPPAVLPATPLGPRPVSPPELILELTQQMRDPAGVNYVVRVLGRERSNDTWEGWLQFVAVGAALVRRTAVETTQSSRADLAYWAEGLGPAYLEGAFQRAEPVASPSEVGRRSGRRAK